jgi:hypothetical protein
MLNAGYFNISISGWVLMLGLILYAVFVATGLVVVSILLTHFIIQATKTQKRHEKQDSGLIELPSVTIGDIVGQQ